MVSAVVFGGYGTFGAHVARELARGGVRVVVAGRDRRQAEHFATELGTQHQGMAADVAKADSCRAVLRGQTVAVNCAGPFDHFGPTLLDACLEANCHYADIADDRGYVSLVRGYGERFRQRGLAAIFGCSSLPGISGALALAAREQVATQPTHVRVALFIGNRNPKGPAAIHSAVPVLGKSILAPQGIIIGFRDRETVSLPQPFGRRAVYNFEGPEYDLLPELLGVRSVCVKLGFELRPVTASFAVLASIAGNYGGRTARLLAWLGKPFGWLGCSGAVVQTDVFFQDGTIRSAAMLARRDGQRMAALPCAFAVRHLCDNPTVYGAMPAYEFLGANRLLDGLVAEGFELHRSWR